MRDPIKYSKADLLSFDILPPTCDAIDAAFDGVIADIDKTTNSVLPKYHLNVNDDQLQQIRFAIFEIVSRVTNSLRFDTKDVVRYEGTFPLRLALVKMIERELLTQGITSERSMYQDWMELSCHRTKKMPNMRGLDENI